MALFIDGSISDIADLVAYDAAILQISSAEGVDLAAKQRAATKEVSIELEEFLARRTGRPAGTGYPSRIPLSQVVVTPPLQQWQTFQTLALIYDDVSANHANSRYTIKLEDYRRRARWAAESLYRTGVGLAHSPIRKAASPTVRVIPGETPAGTYHIQVAWQNGAGDSGAPSEPVILSLSSPGTIGVRANDAPPGVTGFNVYVGDSKENISKQNSVVMEPNDEWVMPGTGLVEGAHVSTGQSPDYYLHNDRILQRG